MNVFRLSSVVFLPSLFFTLVVLPSLISVYTATAYYVCECCVCVNKNRFSAIRLSRWYAAICGPAQWVDKIRIYLDVCGPYTDCFPPHQTHSHSIYILVHVRMIYVFCISVRSGCAAARIDNAPRTNEIGMSNQNYKRNVIPLIESFKFSIRWRGVWNIDIRNVYMNVLYVFVCGVCEKHSIPLGFIQIFVSDLWFDSIFSFNLFYGHCLAFLS